MSQHKPSLAFSKATCFYASEFANTRATGGEGDDDAALELTRSAGSTDSNGFVDLAEEPRPQSVALSGRPAGPARAAASISLDKESVLPDVPDSDHETLMFQPNVLGNLMESYMQDIEFPRQDDHRSHASSAAGAAPDEGTVPRLRTPPGIGGESRQRPCSPPPLPAPARMLATYPEPSWQISMVIEAAVWYIHDGNDWPQPHSGGLRQGHEAKAEASKRGPLHLELWLTGLTVDHLTFPSSKEGDVEW